MKQALCFSLPNAGGPWLLLCHLSQLLCTGALRESVVGETACRAPTWGLRGEVARALAGLSSMTVPEVLEQRTPALGWRPENTSAHGPFGTLSIDQASKNMGRKGRVKKL